MNYIKFFKKLDFGKKKSVTENSDLHLSLIRRQKYKSILLLLPCLVFLLLLFAFPLIRLLWLSLFIPNFSVRNYIKIFEVGIYFKVLLTSLSIAFNCSVICLILGYPVAYLLTIVSARTRNILISAVILPYFLSLLVRVYGWYMILGRNGILNYFLLSFGFANQPLKLLFNNIGVHVGMVNMLLPYMILTLFSVMKGIDKDLLKAARNLGASSFKSFLHVFLPLSLPGVGAGSLLVFILGVGYFVIPALMGGRKEMMIAQLIASQISELMNWEFAAALALLLLVTTGIFILIFNHYLGLDRIWGGEGKELVKEVIAIKEENNEVRRLPLLYSLIKRKNPIHFLFLQKSKDNILHCLFINKIKTLFLRVAFVCRKYDFMPIERLKMPCLYLFCGLVFLFLVAPIFVIIPMSFSSAKYLTFPPPGLSLQWYENYFISKKWISATIVSFKVAGITALIASLLGTSASLSLVRGRFKGKNPINTFIMFPIIIPSIIISIAIYFVFSKLHLTGNTLAIALGHSIITIPIVVTIISANIKGFDETLEKAARNLGAGPIRTYLSIVLPILAPGVISAAFFAFMRSFDEVVIALFICGPATRTLPIRMWEGIREEVDPTITAVSSLLILFCISILITSEFFRRRGERIRGRAS